MSREEQIEQMKKEDQIAELAGQLECGDIPGNYNSGNLVDNIAEQVINAGYRKAGEIRKETAREILERFQYDYAKMNDQYGLGLVKDIAAEYGVEVEE